LWTDDLSRIVDAIRENSFKLEMEADGYAIESIDDFDEWEELRIWRFYLNADDGRIELFLSEDEAVVEVREPSYKDKGLLSEIDDIAANCRRGMPVDANVRFGIYGFLLACIVLAGLVVDRLVTGNGILPAA
jgi:hypothetical protein